MNGAISGSEEEKDLDAFQPTPPRETSVSCAWAHLSAPHVRWTRDGRTAEQAKFALGLFEADLCSRVTEPFALALRQLTFRPDPDLGFN